ncbi:shikimate dehydrogenase [Halobacillus sp. BBL2006]|uniref:shikimate dehydrogenase n=1 Tax=Halobacillus sp. BBL2006 TaxID=1543706 RepID=UPI00068E3E60|nr:shikimate dehydrogenase [Halobacillus sp. BBL2006]
MLKLGLVGHPVGHSMSPWIHEQLMDQQDIKGSYELFDLNPEKFDEEIQSSEIKGLDGFNVTVPYKEKIIPHLADLDESAKELGAVNTVKNTSKGWVGYNTDGTGFVDSLTNDYPNCLNNQARVLLLGSGGASRGIYHALLKNDVATIDIANRTLQRAKDIIGQSTASIDSHAIKLDEAAECLSDYDVVIQTTTVGMSPNDDQQIIPVKRLTKGTIVSDIVYRPMETRFLKEAKEYGARLHFGHQMLLQQAVYAFKIWTETNPDASGLLEEFEKKLKGV